MLNSKDKAKIAGFKSTLVYRGTKKLGPKEAKELAELLAESKTRRQKKTTGSANERKRA
jgi:hypothetical protein